VISNFVIARWTPQKKLRDCDGEHMNLLIISAYVKTNASVEIA
jgi:hypothetical protein